MHNKRIGLTGFSVLGDETRLKIFLKIIELAASASLGEEPVTAVNTAKQLGKVFDLAKSTISHHIDVLKDSGLVFEIKKKKYVYLFPNFAAVSEFRDFLDEEILIFLNQGKYVCISNLLLNRLTDTGLSTFKDFLIINGGKSVIDTKDQTGITKIYFKITGFNEPFYALVEGRNLKIFSIQKNFSAAKEIISQLSDNLVKSFN